MSSGFQAQVSATVSAGFASKAPRLHAPSTPTSTSARQSAEHRLELARAALLLGPAGHLPVDLGAGQLALSGIAGSHPSSSCHHLTAAKHVRCVTFITLGVGVASRAALRRAWAAPHVRASVRVNAEKHVCPSCSVMADRLPSVRAVGGRCPSALGWALKSAERGFVVLVVGFPAQAFGTNCYRGRERSRRAVRGDRPGHRRHRPARRGAGRAPAAPGRGRAHPRAPGPHLLGHAGLRRARHHRLDPPRATASCWPTRPRRCRST